MGIFLIGKTRTLRARLLGAFSRSVISKEIGLRPHFYSYIACHEILRLPTEKVIAELAADLSRIKGNLHPEVVTEVVAAVKRGPTLSPAEQTRIADALSTQAAGGE